MSELHAMMARYVVPGRVAWIGLRPMRRADMVEVEAVRVTGAGPEGDHGRPGKRALTLMQAEHLGAIGAFLDRDPVLPAQMRRNVVVAGLNLAALKGREVVLGSTVVRLTTMCAPCSRMEETFGHGGYAAVRGHGGWCAEIVQEGVIMRGDLVRPVD
ncbi:MAG: MOSC domain-containing protein [Tateyamaria sp.]|uniref:MOSC domain-containing protein n=1 Tax=Tateyamaria sp. TaxID=1929288 RepID=UPI00329CFFBC